MLDTLLRDVRYALTRLGRDRAFTAAAVFTFALCVGANASIFGVVSAVLVRPLPYVDPAALVTIFNSYPEAGAPRAGNGVPDYEDRKREIPAFASLAMWQSAGATLTGDGAPELVPAMRVTTTLFPLLGVAPARGRGFTEAEGLPGAERVVVISDGLWRERFGGSDDALGATLRINDVDYQVIGIMPAGFLFDDHRARLWLPLVITPEMGAPDRRHSNQYEMIGRLVPGATVAQARAQLNELTRKNDERYPHFATILKQAGYHVVADPYRADLVRDVRGTLLLLQGGVLVVLLIGCVNIANLVLVRSMSRARELATRAALGAGLRRLGAQLITETVVLALIGGALGLALGYGALQAFESLGVSELPRGTEVGFDAMVIGATIGLTLLAGLIFGAVPALRLRHADLASIFREEGRGSTATRRALATRGVLVVAQVALAFALLVGAGLTIASFTRVRSTNPGFSGDGVLTAAMNVPPTRYPDPDARRAFFRRVEEQVAALPGVETVGISTSLPFAPFGRNTSVVTPEGYVRQPGESAIAPSTIATSPGYFGAMRIELLEGRVFQESDDASAPPVVVLDETLARKYWPNGNALGQRIFVGAYELGMPADAIVMRTVVGVVREVRTETLVGEQPPGQFYQPFAQLPAGQAFVVVRSRTDPISLVPQLRSAVANIDPQIPLFSVETMDQRVASSLLTERARTVLLVGFASIALLLAGVGLYGVLAYGVAQRQAEIGIRMALGSTERAVFGLVLRQGLGLVGIGLVIGTALSAAGTRVLAGMLHGVSPVDPIVWSLVLLTLGAVATAACLLPAWRAMRVSPAAVLKEA